MASDNSQQDTPLGVLLIATYWIFIGIIFFTFFSSYRSPNAFSLITTLLGIFFILLGWGLISLKTWAYYISLVLSILGIIPAITTIPSAIVYIIVSGGYGFGSIGDLWILFYLLIFVPFIPMTWYLYKNSKVFVKKQDVKNLRRCHFCGRVIPFDSRICPYCARKLGELIVVNEDDKKHM